MADAKIALTDAAASFLKERDRVKIGINALGLLPGVIGGGETYLRGLVHGFGQLRGDDEFLLFTNRENHPSFAALGVNCRRVRCDFSARWNIRSLALTRIFGEQFYLPWRAAREGVELIHSPLDTTVLHAHCPTVMTLHDMNFDALPEAANAAQRAIARALVRLSARRASAIITVSEFSRREIMARLKVSGDRLFVVHNGAGGASAPAESAIPESCAPSAVRPPYLAAFSSINPHKNMAGLMRVFAGLKAGENCQLVIIGHLPMSGESLPELARELGIANRVVFAGYVSERVKRQLMQGARLLAFPSLYEGFGLPVIEAMRAGVPVACSTRAALPEIAGQAARYFDPDDADSFGAALSDLLQDETMRARLVAAGRRNAQRFSWERAARQTMEVYRWAAGRPEIAAAGLPASVDGGDAMAGLHDSVNVRHA